MSDPQPWEAIDWSAFAAYPPNTNYCRCGAVYRSHAKIAMALRRTVTKEPCPECGRHDDLRMSSSEPEAWRISS